MSLTPDLADFFRRQLPKVQARISTEPLSLKALDPAMEILGVFVDATVDKTVFDKLPRLKLIVTFATGVDHIDLGEAKRRGVTVCNVPTYGEETVAEHALMFILALSKNLFQAVKRVKEGVYDYHGLRGFDIEGKTIGLLGTGRIGSRLAKLLSGFDVEILAYDVVQNEAIKKDFGVRYVTKNILLGKSDIISLHLPLLPKTKYIINKQAITRMKPGVYIVNTARGGLIESSALVWGLESGIVAGAGLDVLEDENLLEDPLFLCTACSQRQTATTLMNNILIDHPRVIITPHTAFNTIEAVQRILRTTAENITCFLQGKAQNIVTE